ncbi:class I SAM-dependent methyltransferase [Paeniroseomonas aquatica]|uniref:Class I SAM-dependent methyltransferase n=1 Tax=Paeniroseomonas aquatica TaxID=373043 RepID=A0ABT8A173_9PROT|nr:class I SAM-dependent methyltransferase [Paeniroseomonas aquatica]MDN3563233.1 class I SAM-dependent methyltransferase [Paeniroseomonas aquatica]
MADDRAGPNAAQAAYWNGPSTRAWATHHARIDARFAPVLARALDRAAPRPGARVLDIGCGSGTSTLALAERVGPQGAVLGLDIAADSVAVAERRIAAAGLAQARVMLADAATHPFAPAGFDLLFSRFGVMFFLDPVAAFGHIRGALKPGAAVVLAAFRSPAENAWATGPVAAVRHLLPPAIPPGPEEPGQFAFADPARVQRILLGAGFRDVALEAADLPMRLGADAAEAADFAMTIGQASRAAAGLPEAARAAVREGIAAFYQAHDSAAGVVMPAAIWLVTATA